MAVFNHMSVENLEQLPEYARERWPVAVERAQEKLATVRVDPSAARLLKAAQRATGAAQRVLWLQRSASAWGRALAPAAACRKGCSHCCHIPVAISDIEATFIGRHTGRTPASPSGAMKLQDVSELDEQGRGLAMARLRPDQSPCPFLEDGACTIYEARPMACRTLFNLDDDSLLCQLVPGVEIPVPYADNRLLMSMFVMAQPAGSVADIRDFFPGSRTQDPRGDLP